MISWFASEGDEVNQTPSNASPMNRVLLRTFAQPAKWYAIPSHLARMHIRSGIFSLPFEYPFTISGGRTKSEQPALLVCIAHEGICGWGEAPAIRYYDIDLDVLQAKLQKARPPLEALEFGQAPEILHLQWLEAFPNDPFLVCALDIAYWDLWAKHHNRPINATWQTSVSGPLPASDYTLGIDPLPKMLQKMAEHPWPVYKVKMGFEGDLEWLDTLLKHSPAKFRIDVNAGWRRDEALRKVPHLDPNRIELLEQPLDKTDWEGHALLRRICPVPILADESCVYESDVDRCFEAFDGINIKLTKCGGITPALRMIARARSLQMKVMMGSMNESSIGTAAIAQFVPLLDFVDMDGPLLLHGDYATGLSIQPTGCSLESPLGLGIEVYPDLLMHAFQA